jgi:hypothetical protein
MEKNNMTPRQLLPGLILQVLDGRPIAHRRSMGERANEFSQEFRPGFALENSGSPVVGNAQSPIRAGDSAGQELVKQDQECRECWACGATVVHPIKPDEPEAERQRQRAIRRNP